ncbi:hypothetical protein ACIQXV_11780 [Neobacillus sp. NPDC097160]|uniref:hypothetical protein n=1 Tax=Neobacillus sp. NPDC097160 TaxID=3364298 RepID=UPI003826595F
MLDFEWTHWGEQGEYKLWNYLEYVINEMNKMKETGKEDGTDKERDYANQSFSIVQLLNVLSPIKNAKIPVIKPRNYEEMKEGRIGLEDWKEVAHWSGGEKTTVYMTLFMILINYIRTQNKEFGNPWKVIIADNPFGKASSQHIIQPIFEIAKRNQIQLICLTAHKNEEVVRSFPVVYSIKLRSQLDNVFIRATEEKTSRVTLESAYYRNEKGDPLPTEEKVEIMNHEAFKESIGQGSLI